MLLVTVESSSVHAIGYDQDTRTLEIIFYPGRIYQYADVPPEVYEAFLNAESKGHYFSSHIRDRFNYWQLERAPQAEAPPDEEQSDVEGYQMS